MLEAVDSLLKYRPLSGGGIGTFLKSFVKSFHPSPILIYEPFQ